jgi:hypothetical protein
MVVTRLDRLARSTRDLLNILGTRGAFAASELLVMTETRFATPIAVFGSYSSSGISLQAPPKTKAGGVAGMAMTTPAGALIDATRSKKLFVIIPGICTVIASGIVLLSQQFWLVAGSQVATAVAGSAIGPAVAGITLGILGQAGFNRQNGRNQAFNHASNMVGAALSGLAGWAYGFPAVFWLAAVFGVLSIVSVLMIPRQVIDDDAARGLADRDDNGRHAGECKHIESTELHSSFCRLECSALKSEQPSTTRTIAIPVDNELSLRVWLSRSNRSGSSWRSPKFLKHARSGLGRVSILAGRTAWRRRSE